MARMPGALWKPVSKSRPARKRGRGICLHVAVSEASSLQGFFGGSTSDSHFYVRKDGTIEQYVDTDQVAYANAAGNATLISVETQGGVASADKEPWTAAQLDALARLCRWAADTDGFPLQAMPDSRPASRGVGYHRLGVKPWIVAGGEVWSSSTGKICPGAGKIAQIPQVINLARGVSAGQPPEVPDLDANQAKQLAEAHAMLTARYGAGGRNIGDLTAETMNRVFNIEGMVAALAQNSGASTQQIADLLRPTIAEAVKAGMSADNDAQAEEIVDRLAQRLAGTS